MTDPMPPLPCPFCGQPPKLERGYRYACIGEKCDVQPYTRARPSVSEVRAMWDKRASFTTPDEVKPSQEGSR